MNLKMKILSLAIKYTCGYEISWKYYFSSLESPKNLRKVFGTINS